MDKAKMLCTGNYEPEWLPKFEEILDTERKGFSLGDGSPVIVLKGEELVECPTGREVCTIGYDAVTEDITKGSADVKLLLSVRNGPEENIDIDARTAAGILVILSVRRYAVSVTEFTFLLMLMLARSVVPVIGRIRSEGWTKQNSFSFRNMYAHQSTELYNKNLEIIGSGRDAKSLSVLANASHMQVDTYDLYTSEEVTDSFHVKRMDLDQVAKTADCVIVLARLTPDMGGILSRELIFSMKPTASIVNTRRTRLVNGEAILDALEQQVIKSATLDVHTPGPLGTPSENRIYQIPEDRLVITSHAVGITRERSWHQYHLLCKQLSEYSQGNIPEDCVSKQVFDTPRFKGYDGGYFGIR